MSTTTPSSNGITIDTDLYSRQIGAFGLETMGKLIKMKVLICGLNGAGVETAKNVILAGPHTVALHDNTVTTIQDLASNFFLSEDDVALGVARAEASAKRLSELNDYVNTIVIKGDLTPEIINNFDVVVTSDMKMSHMIEINEFCRSQEPPIGFIAMDGFGLCASIFLDFGNEFTLFDNDGEAPKSAIIEGVTQENPGTVHLHQDKIVPFSTGDYVSFKEIQGMTELNNCEPIQITITGKYCFTINDTTKLSPYVRDGIVEQVKIPSKLHFQSLQHCSVHPLPAGENSLMVPDLAKFGRSEQLHLAVHSVYSYKETHGCLPSPRDTNAVAECILIASRLNAEAIKIREESGEDREKWRAVPVDKIDEDIIRDVVQFSACHISPIAAFLGGVVAQEVVKFTGKFTPLRQWLYFDAFECLPKDPPQDVAPLGCRYDHQIVIWGKEFQNRLGQIQMFLVGAGALGCEFLKSFSLMGCCTTPQNGCLTVTDMDRIEVSNLNRQFLFRRHHVGTSKSRTAAEAAISMNPALNVVATETRVGPDTESDFNDNYWCGLDLVVNALDNIQSRLYIDERCVWYHKPLLESGTLGTKANSQVIIPRMTQSYGDSQDPPEDAIPLCTLRHFPNQIEHTIEWSRDMFQGLFCDSPQKAAAFLSNVDGFLIRLRNEGTSATQRERLSKIHDLLTTLQQGPTMEKCVAKAVKLFSECFDYQIAQLLHTFPLDHMTMSGLPFWSGPKRPPQTLLFTVDDPLHLSFVFAAANLMAYNLGIPQERDLDVIRNVAAALPVEPFVPKDVRIKIDERDPTIEGAADDEVVRERLEKELVEIAEKLRSANLVGKIAPIEFEKDDNTNFHIDFISACANLRARNYRIAECDRHKAKMIAGRIVPAIATTTAMVTGLVSLELLKVVSRKNRKIEDFKNAFVNLGLPLYVLSEPLPPIQIKDKDYDPIIGGPVKAQPNGFTPWDVLEFNIPNATLGDLLNRIEETQRVQVSILSVGKACLFNGFIKSHKERRPKLVKELTESITKTSFPRGRRYVAVEASCSDADGTEVVIPTIKLIFS